MTPCADKSTVYWSKKIPLWSSVCFFWILFRQRLLFSNQLSSACDSVSLVTKPHRIFLWSWKCQVAISTQCHNDILKMIMMIPLTVSWSPSHGRSEALLWLEGSLSPILSTDPRIEAHAAPPADQRSSWTWLLQGNRRCTFHCYNSCQRSIHHAAKKKKLVSSLFCCNSTHVSSIFGNYNDLSGAKIASKSQNKAAHFIHFLWRPALHSWFPLAILSD